ncbi:MAG: hypothetical protein FJ279_35525, partial [Planctomycetes bacterium]|nr:hypothetical protein [Planctomycetota bacterium]
MTHVPRLLWLLLLGGRCGLWMPVLADEPPILRYTTYVLVEVAGKPTRVTFESRPYGSLHADYVYRDQPSYTVIGANSQTLDELDGKLGEKLTVNVPAAAGDFTLVEAKPGNNYCVAHPDGPYGFVATEHAPMNVVQGFQKLYFHVPKGLTASSIFFHAFSVKEAGRALIHDADGKLAAEIEDDFNEPTAVGFRVPEGQDGKVWSVSLVSPRNPDWKLDDCKVWLGGSLPGLLSPKPEWAERLSRPFVVNWRAIFDFEAANPIAVTQWDRPAEKAEPLPAFDVGLSAEQAHSGKQSLRIEMKLPEGAAGGSLLKVFTKPLEIKKLKRVKFWLYGDGSGRKLTVRVRDQSQEHHYCPAGAITWKGWGEVTADFATGEVSVSGGDGNKRIDGPQVSLVIQILHEPG